MNSTDKMNLLDLPEDILSIIFISLDPKSFLALCRTSKVFYSDYHLNPVFWRTSTSTTFRTPVSPLLKTDGARWYSLYKRLRTQTRLFTWGQGTKGELGHGLSRETPITLPNPPTAFRPPRGRGGLRAPRHRTFPRVHSQWPTEAQVPDDVVAIADLQCGGWSTTILSSAGRLYTTGIINAAGFVHIGTQTDRFDRLEYITQSQSAISSFSSGRAHILALTDDGDILSWDRINAKGSKIHSRHGGKFAGKPDRVVAGWGESSAYVPDLGIVFWRPVVNETENDELDAQQVKEKIIPQTARRVEKDGTVQVIAHLVLEGFIVWITSNSQVFACDLTITNDQATEPNNPPVLLPGFFDGTDALRDVQGSFIHFVVFTESGKVLAGDVDYIRRCMQAAQSATNTLGNTVEASNPSNWENVQDLIASRPADVPALQNTGVISVSFGDWHYHALHSDGKITSHGHESESCGALGLGQAQSGSRLRGLVKTPGGMRTDTKLRPIANITGRRIWFEHEKRDWLEHLQKVAHDTFAESRWQGYWSEILNDAAKQTMFSEWIEQEGRHWEDGPNTINKALTKEVHDLQLDDDSLHLSSYFALAIGAAGWHSGALVLVDEEKAEAVKQKWMSPMESHQEQAESEAKLEMPGHFQEDPPKPVPIWVNQPFPRIKFPDGTESPLPDGEEQTLGSALRPWRDGMPTLQDLGLSTP